MLSIQPLTEQGPFCLGPGYLGYSERVAINKAGARVENGRKENGEKQRKEVAGREKRPGEVALLIEHLCSVHKALGSIPKQNTLSTGMRG